MGAITECNVSNCRDGPAEIGFTSQKVYNLPYHNGKSRRDV